MKKIILVALIILIFAGMGFYSKKFRGVKEVKRNEAESSLISLPTPRTKGEVSLEETIAKRRSRRDFLDKSLSLVQLSQILWSAQGITDPEEFKRAAPSAGALYPLEIYLVIGENGVEDLEAGVYHYLPQKHAMEIHQRGDLRRDLAQVALGQYFIAEAPLTLVVTAEYERTTGKYGERGNRYVQIEVGQPSWAP